MTNQSFVDRVNEIVIFNDFGISLTFFGSRGKGAAWLTATIAASSRLR